MAIRELALATRRLAKDPAFAAMATASLALGIGASTAMFSVTNGVLLHPLPYADPGRLVFVISDLRARAVRDFPLSEADFIDLQTSTSNTFENLGAILTGRTAVPQQDGTPEAICWARVTPGFFRLMGARFALGRDFFESDAQPLQSSGGAGAPAPLSPTPPVAAILSYEYWQRRFGGDWSVLGRDLPGSAAGTARIVGILAPRFELHFPPESNIERAPDHWIATRLTYDAANRNVVSLRAIGRLRDGVTLAEAQRSVGQVASDLRGKSTTWQTAALELRVEAMQQHVVATVRPTVIVLTSAAILLLLIACANVANLLLVRASARHREVVVRSALGASLLRLLLPSIAELAILAAVGAACGVGLAWLGIRQLHVIAPPNLPRVDGIAIDARALIFAVVVATAATAIVSLAPVARVWRMRLADALRAGGRAPGTSSGGRLRTTVVVAAVALSFVLIIGSGLMIRSFMSLQRIDPQYDPRGLLTFQLLGSRGGEQPAQRAAVVQQINDRLRAIPGVIQVTASTPFPLAGGFNATRWGTEDALVDPRLLQSADFQTVLPGYFETLRTPLLEGRTFVDTDNLPGRKVVIIDRVLARKAFPHESAIGKRLVVRPNLLAEVIGVVAHQRAASLAEPGREQIYFTDGFMGHGVVSRWAIRTTGDPVAYADTVRKAVATLGWGFVVTDLRAMQALVDAAQAPTRLSLLLMGTFAACAGLLAAVGLYGVLSTAVRQRTSEIGVRMALGAAPTRIFTQVVGHGLRLSTVGIAAGFVGAFVLTRAMTAMLVDVEPTDPVTFAAAVLLFFGVVTVASWLPARRAAALDPLEALHEE
jgi:predicted permease